MKNFMFLDENFATLTTMNFVTSEDAMIYAKQLSDEWGGEYIGVWQFVDAVTVEQAEQ